MRLSLEQLKTLPNLVHLSAPPEGYLFSLSPLGVPKTGLVELAGPLGSGKTEAIFLFLKENPKLKVAWIEKDFTLFPSAIPFYELSLQQILFIDISSPCFKQSLLWCATQLLKSQLFQVLVISHLSISEIELRKFQLLSRQTGTLVFLLQNRRTEGQSWFFTLQADVNRSEKSGNPLFHFTRSRRVIL
jgi:hypothetical protein